MPAGFHGEDRGFLCEFWAPLMLSFEMVPDLSREKNILTARNASWLCLSARLKPGVSVREAETQVNALKTRMDKTYRPDKGHRDPIRLTAGGGLPAGMGKAMVALLGALMVIVTLVLLIACANVANILLARATARRKEISVRLAVGAARGQLVRQMLGESLLLSFIGAFGGVALAWAATRILSGFQLPLPIPFQFDFTPDGRVLLYTVALTTVTALLFGVIPALRASRVDLCTAMKGEEVSLGGHRRFGLRNMLVVVQVACSIVLLVSAGLFLRSLRASTNVDLGLKTDNVLVMWFDMQGLGLDKPQKQQLFSSLRGRVEALPGVRAMSYVDIVPLSFGGHQEDVEAAAAAAGGKNIQANANFYSVGEKYFETMGIPLLRGRGFDVARDQNLSPAVINQALARELFPTGDAVGRVFKKKSPDVSFQVVGIAANTKADSLTDKNPGIVYEFMEGNPASAIGFFGTAVLVRTLGPPRAMARTVEQQIHTLQPNLAVYGLETMQEHVGKALLIPRVCAALLGVFGAVGLLLASIGLYGVMSYSVRRRTREIGIRMALGADQGGVLRMVAGQALLLAAAGVAIGLVLAAAVGQLFTSFLYGISPLDPFTFVVAPAVLVLMAVIATASPARRASRVDPTRALRYE